MAYVSSQARGGIGAATASLHLSHNNVGSELHLRPTPKLTVTQDILNPLSEARDQTCVLMNTSQYNNRLCQKGDSQFLRFCFLFHYSRGGIKKGLLPYLSKSDLPVFLQEF